MVLNANLRILGYYVPAVIPPRMRVCEQSREGASCWLQSTTQSKKAGGDWEARIVGKYLGCRNSFKGAS